jgi:chromosome segregation ATPase
MRLMTLSEYQLVESEVKRDTLDALNETGINYLTPEEIEALIFLQIISVDENEVSEGLLDFVKNPIKATKITNNAKQLAQVLSTKYKIDDDTDDRVAKAETKEQKDKIRELANKKKEILDDKEKAILDRMDELSTDAGLAKMAALLKVRARIKAAEAGISDKDERIQKIEGLKKREADATEKLRELGKKAAEAQAQKAEREKEAAKAEPQQAAEKSPKVESLEDQYARIKSERQQDEAALTGLKEKLTGRSTSGVNGILEKIAAAKAKLQDPKVGADKKELIRKEIDSLQSDAEKLRAKIADFEEGIKITRQEEAELYDKLQAEKGAA